MLGALLFDAAYEVKRIEVIGELNEEAGILEDFARMLEEQRPCLVTFNGRGFDMPVITTRCLRHGTLFRHYYRSPRWRTSHWGMVHASRIQEAHNYCLCDLAQTAGVFLQVQQVRGEIDRERYLSVMRGLIA